MPKITVELDNGDMAELDAAAKAKHVSSEKIIVEVVKAQLVHQVSAGRGGAQVVVGGTGNALAETGSPNRKGDVAIVDVAIADVAKPDDLASRQAARRAALLPAFGMWADDDTKPKDGVAYQKAIRAEWE